MIHLDEKGKVKEAGLIITPGKSDVQQKVIREFAALSNEQRMELLIIGFERLARIWQAQADRVAGR